MAPNYLRGLRTLERGGPKETVTNTGKQFRLSLRLRSALGVDPGWAVTLLRKTVPEHAYKVAMQKL